MDIVIVWVIVVVASLAIIGYSATHSKPPTWKPRQKRARKLINAKQYLKK